MWYHVLFVTVSNMANNADDTTLYERNKNMNDIFEWFQNSYLEAYNGKSQAILTTGYKLKTNVGCSMCNKTTVKQLGMSHKSLEPQLNTECKEIIHKLHVLCRFSNYISQ